VSVRLQEMFGIEPDAERRRGPDAPAAEIIVAGEASGANHPGSRELFGIVDTMK